MQVTRIWIECHRLNRHRDRTVASVLTYFTEDLKLKSPLVQRPVQGSERDLAPALKIFVFNPQLGHKLYTHNQSSILSRKAERGKRQQASQTERQTDRLRTTLRINLDLLYMKLGKMENVPSKHIFLAALKILQCFVLWYSSKMKIQQHRMIGLHDAVSLRLSFCLQPRHTLRHF